MAKAKPRFNPNEAAARMFISTQVEQDTHDAQPTPSTHDTQVTQPVLSTHDTHDTQSEQQVHSTHDTQNAQPIPNTQNTHSTHDAQSTHSVQGTQRAQKHPRINMAFYGDNLEFVREEAWRNKQSITEYVNSLIEQARNKKGE